jgi:hypothetical protein
MPPVRKTRDSSFFRPSGQGFSTLEMATNQIGGFQYCPGKRHFIFHIGIDSTRGANAQIDPLAEQLEYAVRKCVP